MLHENPRLSDVDEHDEFESVSIDESCIMTSREISVFFYSDTKRRVVTAAHSFCCIFCVGILCILWLITLPAAIYLIWIPIGVLDIILLNFGMYSFRNRALLSTCEWKHRVFYFLSDFSTQIFVVLKLTVWPDIPWRLIALPFFVFYICNFFSGPSSVDERCPSRIPSICRLSETLIRFVVLLSLITVTTKLDDLTDINWMSAMWPIWSALCITFCAGAFSLPLLVVTFAPRGTRVLWSFVGAVLLCLFLAFGIETLFYAGKFFQNLAVGECPMSFEWSDMLYPSTMCVQLAFQVLTPPCMLVFFISVTFCFCKVGLSRLLHKAFYQPPTSSNSLSEQVIEAARIASALGLPMNSLPAFLDRAVTREEIEDAIATAALLMRPAIVGTGTSRREIVIRPEAPVIVQAGNHFVVGAKASVVRPRGGSHWAILLLVSDGWHQLKDWWKEKAGSRGENLLIDRMLHVDEQISNNNNVDRIANSANNVISNDGVRELENEIGNCIVPGAGLTIVGNALLDNPVALFRVTGTFFSAIPKFHETSPIFLQQLSNNNNNNSSAADDDNFSKFTTATNLNNGCASNTIPLQQYQNYLFIQNTANIEASRRGRSRNGGGSVIPASVAGTVILPVSRRNLLCPDNADEEDLRSVDPEVPLDTELFNVRNNNSNNNNNNNNINNGDENDAQSTNGSYLQQFLLRDGQPSALASGDYTAGLVHGSNSGRAAVANPPTSGGFAASIINRIASAFRSNSNQNINNNITAGVYSARSINAAGVPPHSAAPSPRHNNLLLPGGRNNNGVSIQNISTSRAGTTTTFLSPTRLNDNNNINLVNQTDDIAYLTPFRGIHHQNPILNSPDGNTTLAAINLNNNNLVLPNHKSGSQIFSQCLPHTGSVCTAVTNADECFICFDSECGAVMDSCGHGGVCVNCANEVVQRTKKCPLCREPVNSCFRLVGKAHRALSNTDIYELLSKMAKFISKERAPDSRLLEFLKENDSNKLKKENNHNKGALNERNIGLLEQGNQEEEEFIVLSCDMHPEVSARDPKKAKKQLKKRLTNMKKQKCLTRTNNSSIIEHDQSNPLCTCRQILRALCNPPDKSQQTTYVPQNNSSKQQHKKKKRYFFADVDLETIPFDVMAVVPVRPALKVSFDRLAAEGARAARNLLRHAANRVAVREALGSQRQHLASQEVRRLSEDLGVVIRSPGSPLSIGQALPIAEIELDRFGMGGSPTHRRQLEALQHSVLHTPVQTLPPDILAVLRQHSVLMGTINNNENRTTSADIANIDAAGGGGGDEVISQVIQQPLLLNASPTGNSNSRTPLGLPEFLLPHPIDNTNNAQQQQQRSSNAAEQPILLFLPLRPHQEEPS